MSLGPVRGRAVAAAVAVVAVVATACTTTVAGSGTRAGGGPSVTGFPSASSSESSARPTDSSSPTSTGTGGGDASDLVAAMVDDMTAVDSGFAMNGDFEGGGDVSGLDLRMQGDTGTGTIALGDESCEIRAVDGEGWAKAPASFWSDYVDLDDDIAAGIEGKWVELTDDIEFLLAFVDQDTFVNTIIPTTDDYTLGDTTTRDGVDAQEVDSDDATLVITVDSPHLLLAIVDDTGTADFTYPDDDLQVDTPSPTVPFPA